MRCTGSGSSADCCVAFDNGVCSNDLTCTETNFVANEQNNYTCGINISIITNDSVQMLIIIIIIIVYLYKSHTLVNDAQTLNRPIYN